MNEKHWDRVAAEYDDHIVSPLKKNVVNPIFRRISEIKGGSSKITADFGCGTGEMLKFLAKRFAAVHAVDFSEKMIEEAKKKNKGIKNIFYAKETILDLHAYKRKIDLALSINSVLFPSAKDQIKSLKEIFLSLKKGGVFIGIFPSMESVVYNSILVFHRELKKAKTEASAYARAKRIAEDKKYDYLRGIYFHNKEEAEKFFYKEELAYLLKHAGFRDIEFDRVLYPWNKRTSDFELFPGEEKMWDWFVMCRRRD